MPQGLINLFLNSQWLIALWCHRLQLAHCSVALQGRVNSVTCDAASSHWQQLIEPFTNVLSASSLSLYECLAQGLLCLILGVHDRA
eukprot:773340-Pelagomonas_calceolata.AAC.2